MTKPISILVRSATATLIAATLIPGALWAESDTVMREARNQATAPAIAAPAGPSQADCNKARSDARFLRQMQLTDGDVIFRQINRSRRGRLGLRHCTKPYRREPVLQSQSRR